MYCTHCKKENLEIREINRLVTKDDEEIIICDECRRKESLQNLN